MPVNPLPPEQWTRYDVIPPGGLKRWMLDRSITDINQYWDRGFGYELSPVGRSVQVLLQAGRLAIADFGCGTENTLVTLQDKVYQKTKASLGVISCIGIDRHDYKEESLNPRTREAVAGGEVTYVVGNATDPNILPANSQDIVIASSAIGPQEVIVPWLNNMLRVTRPGGMLFFNVIDDYFPIVHQLLEQWSSGGAAARHHVKDGPDQIFFWVRKPHPRTPFDH